MTENSRRSAHATIRGYLYQTCLGVLRWLDLQPNEVLVCEGDEDLDRHLLDGKVVSEQVKAYSGRLGLGDQAVLESLFNFLVTYVALRREDKDRTFIFTTTAEPRPQRKTGLDFDLLEKWREGIRNRKVVSAVRSLLKPKKENTHRKEIEEARTWLDGQPEGWVGFMNAVEWTFNAPSLGTLREDILRRLTEREDTSLLPPDTFLERLVVHVLETSCRDQRQDRHVTPGSLTQLIEASRTSLRSWAQSERAKRLRIILDEADPIEELLSENTSSLPRNASPGKLLTAAYEIIPFDEAGRTEEITFLKAWCEGNDPKSVVLLTGEGGSGKTRLMIEWCRRLRHRGWHAGFLLPLTEDAPRDLSPLLNGVSSRLIVVDYAETRLQEVGSILERMGQARDKKDPKVRLVLLARRSGDWWNNLPEGRRAVQDLLLDSEPPRSITPLIPKDPERREEAFHLAMLGFAQELDIAPPETPHIPDLASKDFDRVLYLHMAAHATALGQRIETAADALSRTLEHEQLFWRQQVADLKLDGTQRPLILKALKLSVATVTLTYGVEGYQQALSLLNRALKDLPLPAHYLDSLIDLLRNVYGRSGAAGLSIDPLQPDLLGEELVAQTLTREPDLIGRVLEQCSAREARYTLVVLSRLVRRFHQAEEWIRVFAQELKGKGTQEIWRTLQQLCDDDDYQKSVPLREIALIATEENLRLLRERSDQVSEANQAEHARLLNNLGSRLSDLGRREDALQATEQAVEIRRRLALERPDVFRPDLASSLNNLGAMYSDLGRREDALQTTEQAVEIRRRLALERSDAFRHDLANSLNNLGAMYSALGRREDALQATEQAVEIYRQLAIERPDAFRHDLANSLNNLGTMYSALGRREDALQATEQAVEIYRQLAIERPDAFRHDLAMGLNNLGNRYSELGRREDALQATEEAVRSLSPLFLRFPAAFASWMETMVRNYLRHAEAAGQEPNEALLTPILQVFQTLNPDQPPEEQA
jgi:tetratricopeptide (TPR) repeat protein